MTINAAVPSDQCISVVGTLQPCNLNLALYLLDSHEQPRGAIVMHSARWRDIEDWEVGTNEEIIPLTYTNYDIEDPNIDTPPIWGHYKNVPIYVSNMCPKNAIYILSKKEYIGTIPVEQDIEVAPVEFISTVRTNESDINPLRWHNTKLSKSSNGYQLECTQELADTLEKSWIVSARVGVHVMNDWTIARILVNYSTKEESDLKQLEEENWELKHEIINLKRTIQKLETKLFDDEIE